MKTDLLSMGYRCLGTNAAGVTVWAKPFGNTLLVIAVSGADLTLAQHFKGRDGQSLVWSTQKYDQAQDGTLLQWIQYTETFHVKTRATLSSQQSRKWARAATAAPQT